MENTSYGINVANRYDLFSIDDDADDPFEAIVQNTQKSQKKVHISSADNTSSKATSRSGKNVEKENKSVTNKINNENRHPDKYTDTKVTTSGSSSNNLYNQRNEKHTIKETQKDNIRTPREEGNKNGYAPKNFERRQINKGNPTTIENREEKNNRRNRDVNNDEISQRKLQNFTKRSDFRGKREYDRQSGSNKTGVKAIEKRDGAGSHNWGSAKADAKEYNSFQEDYVPQDTEEEKNHIADPGKDDVTEQHDIKIPVEEELKEMTLDEWKAQLAAARSKPQYNLRKAGEGEDATQWDKMVALDKKKTEVGVEEENETQKTSKQKQVLDIEFHFNDGRRGGLMGRSRARGGKGARNTGKRDGERNEDLRDSEIEKRDRRNRPSQPGEANVGSYKTSKQNSRFKTVAPKVDDEHDFPSLG